MQINDPKQKAPWLAFTLNLQQSKVEDAMDLVPQNLRSPKLPLVLDPVDPSLEQAAMVQWSNLN